MLPWQRYFQEAFGRKNAKNGRKIMVFAPYCPKSSLNPLFEPAIRKNLIFDGTSGKIREPKVRNDVIIRQC